LAGVLLALATTGLRISELSGLRWSDIDLDGGMIRLVDETSSGRRRVMKKGSARTLKSGRGRTFPIQEELLPNAIKRAANH
jgi:integrase